MIKCKQCKYWKPPISSFDIKYNKGNGDCNCEKFVYVGEGYEDVNSTDCLGYWDSESYAAGFTTGPDFGCIHGVKK